MDDRVRHLQTLGSEPGRRNWWRAAWPLSDAEVRKLPFVQTPPAVNYAPQFRPFENDLGDLKS